MTPKSKTAFYPGSFRPFTIGHKSIVERTLRLCDHVVIAIGINPAKPADDISQRADAIRAIFAGEPRVSVITYCGLTADAAREAGADFMIRGLRNTADFEFERNLAEVNLRIAGVETLFMPALPELAFVSSSMIRELESFGHDASQFIAKP